MRIGVFITENNAEHDEMLLAFAKGIRACGFQPLIAPLSDYSPVDIAVVFGIGKKNVPVSFLRGRVIEMQHAAKKNVIIIEKGFVKRDKYYMVGFNGLNNRATFNNNECNDDRWRELDVELKPLNDNGRKIIVCGQVPSDASVQHIDIIEWCSETIRELRQSTEMPIVFRPHPLAIDRTPAMIGAQTSTRPLEEDLKEAHAVITYNSNAAVEAIIAGVPAYSDDIGSMAFSVSNRGVWSSGDFTQSLVCPYFPSNRVRYQWASNLAYTQWNKTEFECGLPWAHLTQMVKSKRGNLKEA